MKQLLLVLIINLTTINVFAEGACDHSQNRETAEMAVQTFEQKLRSIPGVVLINVDTCYETETFAPGAENGVCGVYVWFSSFENRNTFHKTTKLWNGLLSLPSGQNVPLCSRVALRRLK